MNHRTTLLAAGLFGATGVAIGAFGAHGLHAFLLERGMSNAWETGVRYHLLHAVALLAVTVVAMCASQRLRESPSHMLHTSMATLFPVVFVGVSMSYAVGLRMFPGELGEDLLMLLFLCVIATNTAAYYVGTAWGQHRLAPRVSPKKSWEGAISGLVGVLVLAVVVVVVTARPHGNLFWVLRTHLGWAGMIVACAALVALAVTGDLVESLVKRAAGMKDSSRLLTGHGGVLDRIDALLPVFPAALALVTAF